jgi:hypothetical protein
VYVCCQHSLVLNYPGTNLYSTLLQARADTLEDLLLKAEDFLRSANDHGDAEAASEFVDSRPGSRIREDYGR